MTQTIRFTVDQLLQCATEKYLEIKNPGLKDEQRIQKLPIARYNMLVHGLHVGVALLTSAIALSIFAKFGAAAVFIALGLLLYRLSNRELEVMLLPANPNQVVRNIANIFGNRNKAETHEQNAARNVLDRLGLPRDLNWVPNRLVIGDMPIIKNYVPEAR